MAIINNVWPPGDHGPVTPETTLMRANAVATPKRLAPPCTYQGGKQRISRQVVDHILADGADVDDTRFFDVCCGSGAISIELLNRGVAPDRIVMIDISSWGAVWSAIGAGTFDLGTLRGYIDQVPNDKLAIHAFATELAKEPASVDEIYKYLILQACSFGGKQIWRDGDSWRNAFFRRHWLPTASSVRQSPANVMQPSPQGLYERLARLADAAAGVRGLQADVSVMLNQDYDARSIIYVDPPYSNTTSYGFNFDLGTFVTAVQAKSSATIYVSEAAAVSPEAVRIDPAGARGGISGNRRVAHEEWLNSFRCA